MRFVKLLLAAIAAIVVLDIAFSSVLSYYDAKTRQRLVLVADQELRPHASNQEMLEFLRRHTTRYAFDAMYQHEYAGFVPQTRLDRMLFDRKVQVVLKVDQSGTFMNAEARVYYTGL